jgi:hypothetical protein
MSEEKLRKYNYNKTRKKKGEDDITTVAKRYQVYNNPTNEDKKVYHNPIFMYKSIKAASKKSTNQTHTHKLTSIYNNELNTKPLLTHAYVNLIDECENENNNACIQSEESAYNSETYEETEYENEIENEMNKLYKTFNELCNDENSEKSEYYPDYNHNNQPLRSYHKPNLRRNKIEFGKDGEWALFLIKKINILIIDLINTKKLKKNMNPSHLDQSSNNSKSTTKRLKQTKAQNSEITTTSKTEDDSAYILSSSSSSGSESESELKRKQPKNLSSTQTPTSNKLLKSFHNTLNMAPKPPLGTQSLHNNLNKNKNNGNTSNHNLESHKETNETNFNDLTNKQSYSNRPQTQQDNRNSNNNNSSNNLNNFNNSNNNSNINSNNNNYNNNINNNNSNMQNNNTNHRTRDRRRDNRTAAERRLAKINNTKPKGGKIVITFDENSRHKLNEQSIKREASNLSFTIKSTDIIQNRLYVYTNNEKETELLLDENTNFFQGQKRKNLETNSFSLIMHNISMAEVKEHEQLCNQLEKLGILNCEAVDQEDQNEISIKAYVGSKNALRDLFIKYYESGIAVKIGDEEININIQPNCGRPTQCYKCWQIGHVRSECRPDQPELCAACGYSGHESANCFNNLYCTFCQGGHNALDKKNCEKYRKLCNERKRDALERITGIKNFSKNQYALKTFAEAASYTKDIVEQNKINDQKFASRAELADTIQASNKALERAESALKTSQDYLKTVVDSMKQEALLATNKVYSEIAASANNVLQSISQNQSRADYDNKKLEIIVRKLAGSQFEELEYNAKQYLHTNQVKVMADPNHLIPLNRNPSSFNQ